MASPSVSARMNALRDRGQCALVPYITAGDPDLETTAQALRLLDRSGADV
ncbi:MAG: tryptophan synthase subunit alpha, partial [Cyanobacteria bacterium P01_A01_bin.135]